MENNHLIFVYGTLRQSQGNHQLLKDACFYGVGSSKDRYSMYIVGGYPYVTSSETRYPIVGELYSVDDETLEMLDKMEGHPHYYKRREFIVIVNEVEYCAWMYVRDPHGSLMPTGDYNDSVHRR